jgi:hypothetical protein
MKGENPFKVREYHNDLEAVIKAGRLKQIKGIGDA